MPILKTIADLSVTLSKKEHKDLSVEYKDKVNQIEALRRKREEQGLNKIQINKEISPFVKERENLKKAISHLEYTSKNNIGGRYNTFRKLREGKINIPKGNPISFIKTLLNVEFAVGKIFSVVFSKNALTSLKTAISLKDFEWFINNKDKLNNIVKPRQYHEDIAKEMGYKNWEELLPVLKKNKELEEKADNIFLGMVYEKMLEIFEVDNTQVVKQGKSTRVIMPQR